MINFLNIKQENINIIFQPRAGGAPGSERAFPNLSRMNPEARSKANGC